MKTIKSIFAYIYKLLLWLWKKYPEVYSIPAAFAVWLLSATVLRWIDPTAAAFDAGVLQIPIFSILLLFVFLSISWLTMGLLFGTARNFLKTELKKAFFFISSWEKIKYSTGIFFALFLSLILLSFILS